jgi:20S proteasome subunit beta 2
LIGSVSIDALCHFLQEALYDAKGQLGANLILGGVWRGQAYLRAIHPHGSMDVELPFCALGSGGLAAMGVLERGYRNNLSVEEGIALVQRAIVAGIRNDLGSGSQVDLCVIAPDGTSRLQRRVVPEEELEEGFRAAVVEEDANKVEGDNNLGVNGFGNLPFAVQSKKVLLASAETAEEERLAQWNEFLGLKEADKGR